jgi:hypothetical protein
VQLCLELGLVDEAKNITKTWMGRWYVYLCGLGEEDY